MAGKDMSTKLLTRDNDVFAELFNTFVFKGKVIDPGKLEERDTSEITMIVEKMAPRQRFRDVLKHAEIKYDDKFAYFLLGLENQTDIHYAMPVRAMLYDALTYSKQVDDIFKKNKGAGERYSGSEWLSRFPAKGNIKPVITLVLCWSPKKWDGPKSLHEMMDQEIVERFKDLIEDYKLHLTSVYDLEDKVLRSFSTDVGLALEFSKYSDNKKKILEFSKDERFRNRSNEFVATINEMTRTKFKLNLKGGTVDMCEGLDELCKDFYANGRHEGLLEGKLEGKQEGIAETISKMEQVLRSSGVDEEVIRSARSKIENL